MKHKREYLILATIILLLVIGGIYLAFAEEISIFVVSIYLMKFFWPLLAETKHSFKTLGIFNSQKDWESKVANTKLQQLSKIHYLNDDMSFALFFQLRKRFKECVLHYNLTNKTFNVRGIFIKRIYEIKEVDFFALSIKQPTNSKQTTVSFFIKVNDLLLPIFIYHKLHADSREEVINFMQSMLYDLHAKSGIPIKIISDFEELQ